MRLACRSTQNDVLPISAVGEDEIVHAVSLRFRPAWR
jgi:hypothetical protein